MFPKPENSPYFQRIFRSNPPWQDGMDMGRFLEISGSGSGGVILSNIHGDYQNPRSGNPSLKQPGLNGMTGLGF